MTTESVVGRSTKGDNMANDVVVVDRRLAEELTDLAFSVLRQSEELPITHPVWQLAYLAGKIVTSSRFIIFEQAFLHEIEEFFRPRTSRERGACSAFAFKLVHGPRDRNFFEVEMSDNDVIAVLDAARMSLANGSWKMISIGPKSTPMLHAMRERVLRANASNTN